MNTEAHNGKRTTSIVFLLCGSLFAVLNFTYNQTRNPLSYDEGDYYRAVQNGFWTNWTDSDDISLADFGGKGLEAVQGKRSIAELSSFIRSANSTAFFRHYHPPLPLYPVIAIRALFPHDELEYQMRLANLFWMLLWVILIAVLFPHLESHAWLAALLLPASTGFGMASSYFNMHVPFAVFLSLFLITWMIVKSREESRVFRFAALFFLACAVCTVEYGSFLLALLALWSALGFLRSSNRAAFLRLRFRDLLFFLLFLLLLWPASLLQLNLARSYLFVAYILYFRLDRIPPMDTLWDALLWKWNSNPFELFVAFVVIALVVDGWRRVVSHGPLFVSVGFIALLIVLHFNRQPGLPWYLLSLFSVVFTVLLPTLLVEWKATFERHSRVSMAGFAGIALVFLLLSIQLAERPLEEYRISLKEIVEQAPGDTIIAPVSIYTWLQGYHQKRPFLSYHDSLGTEKSFADSVAQWRRTRLVITPQSYQPPDSGDGGWYHGYRVFKRSSYDDDGL